MIKSMVITYGNTEIYNRYKYLHLDVVQSDEVVEKHAKSKINKIIR